MQPNLRWPVWRNYSCTCLLVYCKKKKKVFTNKPIKLYYLHFFDQMFPINHCWLSDFVSLSFVLWLFRAKVQLFRNLENMYFLSPNLIPSLAVQNGQHSVSESYLMFSKSKKKTAYSGENNYLVLFYDLFF